MNPYWIIAMGTEAMIIISIGVLLWLNLRQKSRLVFLLNQKRQESEYQQDLLVHQIRAEEMERRRIAAELHDSVSHSLLMLQMNWPVESPWLEGKKRIKSLQDEIRQIGYSLFPPGLETWGLKHELDEMKLQLLHSSIAVSIEIEPAVDEIPVEMKLPLFRICQEWVQNALKHSGAEQISIQLTKMSGEVKMAYRDDGVGISDITKNRGMGTMNIATRVMANMGRQEVISAENAGLSWNIWFPILDK